MMTTREQRRAVGVSEFATMFGISKDTAKRHAKNGSLRTILIGKRRLVPISECERIEKEGLVDGRKRR